MDVPCNSPCLLVATTTEIIALDYNTATTYPIISSLSIADTIDYHYNLGYIFWSDNQEHNIKRSNLDGKYIKILHKNTLCRGLAVDWRSSQLYWTTYLPTTTVSVSDLDGNNTRVLLERPKLDLDGIVIDPERG